MNNPYFEATSDDCFAHCANPAFDAATWEIWGALLNGARLLVVPPPAVMDPAQLNAKLYGNGVTALWLTVGLFNQYAGHLGDAFGQLRYLLVGGDALDPKTIRQLLASGQRPAHVVNGYGPTETTTFAITHDILAVADDARSIPLGKPIANTQVYILDGRGEPVPAGVEGELYIGGHGVARGYLNRAELTAERFLKDPFSADANARMYKTGDRGRWLADGTIEFLGRNDFQVKLRGFRIELGEIETRLSECAGVRDAIVIAREDVPGDKRLVAYLVAEDELSVAGLRDSLSRQLPEYMVPSAFVQLDALPLTANGKVDRKALPSPETTALSVREYEAPQGEIEEKLAALWQELLRVERVGRHDNFFELGGHSLLAVQLISHVRTALNVELPLRELFATSSLSALADAVRAAGASTLDRIEIADRNQPLPLSLAQQRLWFLDQLDGSAAYHIPTSLRLIGDLDVTALRAALDRLVARHEVLRTSFAAVDGVPYQQIAAEDRGFALALRDLRGMENLPQVVAELTAEEARAPFDLSAGPLVRGSLLRVADDQHVLLVTQHHIVSDGWSLNLFTREVAALYAAFTRGEADPLPALEIQYADYAQWQRQWLQGEELARQFDFWKAHLSGAPALLELPTDRPRPAAQSHAGDTVPFTLSAELTAALRALAQRHGATMFMTLLSAWGVLLSRLSGQSDVVIGTPVANRQRQEVESLIGFFVNTLALRLRFDEQPSVASLLGQAKEATLGAFAHQELPFEQVVEAVQPQRSLSHGPLFQTMLALNNTDLSSDSEFQLPGLRLAAAGNSITTSQQDLSIHLTDAGDAVSGFLVYTVDLFDRETVERWAGYFARVLEAMVADESATVDALPLLPDAERHQVLYGFNATAAEYPADTLIHELFERQAASQPDTIAVVFEHDSLTYGQLNARANQLAHELIARGVQPDDRVAICAERSLEMVVGLLGTLKAGGAYVPLDPTYPADRLQYMLHDAAPKAVLTQQHLQPSLPATGAPALLLDREAFAARPSTNPERRATVRNLAYVIYTSGSTGMPKGVLNEHQGVVNRLWWAQSEYRLQADDRVLQKTPFGFDVSVWEFFLPLLAGARLVMARPGGHQDPAYLTEVIAREQITTLHFVPSMIPAFLTAANAENCASLRRMLCSGEALPHSALVDVAAAIPQVEVHNLYGPTEAAVDVTAWPCRVGQYGQIVPIGRPIANTQMYVLDSHGEPVPVGVEGELFIGGVQVARGYLNRPELTAERFVKDPFSTTPDARMYKTGDLGRWLPDGNIEYRGRNDFQVKLRGFRIELGEIEARLNECAGVRESVVVAREDVAGDKRLVAYLVAEEGMTLQTSELRAALSAQLPEYMVPSAMVTLAALPLSANGKLDRKALPAPDATALAARVYEAPQGEIETALAAIWQDLLKVPQVGRHDHFFELGGHSLLAVQVLSRIRTTLGVELPLRTVFAAGTLAALSGAVSVAGASTMERIQRADRGQALPLSLAQQRLWFLDQLDKQASAAYHMASALRLTGKLDVAALQATLDRLVARHEVLRTAFVAKGGVPYQQIAPEDRGFALALHDLRELDEDSRTRVVAERTAGEARAPFDLTVGPLIRGSLLRVADDEHVLLITQHHIISDGWSLNILVREVAALYTAFTRGESDPLPELEIQYADYAQWQRNWLQGEELARQFDFWKGHLTGAPALLSLPLDRPRPAVQSPAGGMVSLALPPALTASLRAFSQRHGVTLFMTLLSAWGALLSRLSGQQDVVVGTPVANRQRREVENLIGFFVNTLALRLRFDSEPSVAALLEQVKETTLAAFAHQELPFEQVVDAVQPERSLSHSPLFQTMLAFNNTSEGDGEGARSLPDLKLAAAQEAVSATAQYELSLNLNDGGAALFGTLTYASDLFDHSTIERWAGHFVRLLEAMVAEPAARVGSLPLLAAAEREQLLAGFNATAVAYPSDALIHQVFEQHAAARRDAPAVVFEDRTLTYSELNARANQLAHALIEAGIQADDRVAVAVERGLDLAVSFLGVLKAGGAYVPLDAAYPAERLQFMLNDAAPKVVLTRQGLRLPAVDAPVWALDSEDVLQHLESQPSHDPRADVAARHLAYVIYTSGSTGQPKGVMVEHRGVCNLAYAQSDAFGVDAASRVLQFASPAFDASISELVMTFVQGACLCLASRDAIMPGEPLQTTLRDLAITHVTLPSTALAACGDADFPALQSLIVAGEACPPAVAERWHDKVRFFNAYGPTETTVCATLQHCDEVYPATVPIGRPIANTTIYILDANRQPVPVGVEGEIYIGGNGVARGYRNRPDLTAERFIADPFRSDPNARMYKTGDLGRWLADGSIEYLGRNDFQVKVRGFRIELGEIETKLAACAGVREAVVIAREDVPGDKRLVAYVVGSDLSVADLRDALSAQLPEYMVPAAFVQLDAIPVTSNGKVDRKALPAPDGKALVRREYEAPQGELEEQLAAIWRELLHVERAGRHDTFFELGGHSLLAVQLISRIRTTLGVDIALRDVFAKASLRALAEAVREAAASTFEKIEIADRTQFLPLSLAQQRLWFLDQLDKSASAAYHMPVALRLLGNLDVAALRATLDRLVARHEVLRTSFVSVDGVPYQQIAAEDFGFALKHEDLRSLSSDDREAVVARLTAEEAAAPFDLSSGSLIRGSLLTVADDEHVLLITQHHIISDGWSMNILIREVAALYTAFTRGESDPLPALELQYADYAQWQRNWLQGEELARQFEFWKTHLTGAPALLDLPLDRPRPAVESHAGDTISLVLPPTLTADLRAFSQQHGVTLFMTLLSAWGALLSRLSGQQDVVVGTPVANRQRREVENLLGFFVNTLALRMRFDAKDGEQQPSVSALLEQVKDTTLAAFAHQELPFEQVVDAVQPQRSLSHSPLFQTMLAFNNTSDGEGGGALTLPELQLAPAQQAQTTAQYELSLNLNDSGETLTGNLTFARDLFDASTIERWAGHYVRLLEAMVADSSATIETLPLLSVAERGQLLTAFNATAAAYPSDKLIHELFEQQAAAHPKSVAVICEDHSLTYGELNARANRLAHELIAMGVQPDDRVAICTERGLDMVVGLLGILKAGGAYLPLDPAYPSERLQYLLEDGAPKALLTQKALQSLLPAGDVPSLLLDGAELRTRLSAHPSSNPASGVTARNLAYIIYTSGSTGRPKGVAIEHANTTNLLYWALENFSRQELFNSLFSTSINFDLAVYELFAPLAAGSTLTLVRNALALTARPEPVTLINTVPSAIKALLDAGGVPATARVVNLAGEPLKQEVVERIFAETEAESVANLYGPSETTTYSTWVRMPREQGFAPHIGRPLANTQVYILDAHRELVPVGVAGEIYIGGAGVARGYLNRPELTAERFLKDPFSADADARMYKTGDLGRWLPDGNIEYLGRNDFQVKIRGFRIELGEIEAKLAQCAGVREAVVVAREDVPGDKRLIAYVVGSGLSIASLRTELARQLPEYMVPSLFLQLDAMPLTPNGKLDRKALPAPETTSLSAREYEAPRGDAEESIAAIWRELLHVDRVGRHDNFFELGGHSLLAVQLISRIRTTLGVDLALRDVFATATLQALAEAARDAVCSTLGRIEIADRTRHLPLSLAQQRLWFLDQLDKSASVAYHMPAALRLLGDLDVEALQATLDRLVARHEILRTSFVAIDGVPYQQIAPEDRGFALLVRDLRGLDEETRADVLAQITAEEARAPFELSAGPLIRGQLLTVADGEHLLLITQHHIISDGWSLNVLVREVGMLYAAFTKAEADPLPALDIQYADYAQWQRNWLQGEELARQFDFWKGHLTGAPALLELPLDRPRPAVQSHAGGSVSVNLTPALSASLRAFSQRHGVTLFMTLLSAWGALLSRLSGQTDVVVGMPVANRQRREVENLLGFFVNTLALRLRLDEQPTVEALLAQVKETTLAAFAHQELPFEQIVDAVQPERSLSHSPLFQTMLAFNNTSAGEGDGGAHELPGLRLAPAKQVQTTAQYELSLSLNDGGDALSGTLVYASDLFDEATIERWAGQYVRLLEAMVVDAAAPVDTLPLLSASERRQVLVDLNATDAAYPSDALIHELFEQQAAARPDAVAAVFEGRSLTYAELNARANQLAHELIALGVQPDDRVAICAERSLELVAALLGILKAGGAYVPLDPAYPAERLRYLLSDAAPKVVLTSQAAQLPESGVPTLALEADRSSRPEHNPSVDGLHARNLAYVIYTSGSTGTPKGVMVDHRCVNRLVLNNPYFEATTDDCFAHCANPAFDAATWEIWGALLNGARLLVVPSSVVMDPSRLNATLHAGGVTALWLTVGLFNQYVDSLPDAFGQLRYLLVGGDALDPKTIRQLLASPNRPLHVLNGYGPTETTTFAITHDIRTVAGDARSIPLGKPIANTQIYILDAHGEPVPMGVEGEIYIGGDGVARGYLNRPELTAERFLRNPFRAEADARMYKTGDRGRWLADGTIEFLGRNDFQVKLRGFRIELGEIEAKLSRCAGVRDAVVLAREDAPGDKRLVAYLVADVDLSVTELRDALSQELPDYMIPSAFVQIDALPLTANGKVDRKVLPAPEATALLAREYEAPVGAIEQQLAAIWQELLHVERVGRHDNFFELGGHSLLAVQLISRIRTVLGVDVALRDVFAKASLQGLAEAAQEAVVSTTDRIEVVDRNQRLPLSLGQQRLWFLDQLDKAASAAYHLPAALRLVGKLDATALQATLDRIVARHEILRTRFAISDGLPYQQIAAEDSGFALDRVDLRHLADDERESVVARLTAEEACQPFDFSAGPLIRGRLVALTDDEHVLLLTQHHIISDGWSLNLLVREVATLYGAFRLEQADPLPPLEIQYADYAWWQRSWLQGDELARQFQFWKNHLTGAPALLNLPLDRPRPALQTYAGDRVALDLSPELTDGLRALSQRHGVTLFMTLLSAWGLLLSRLSGQPDVIIGTPVANRQRREVENLLGFFVNTLALRLRFDAQPIVASLLAQVKETTLAAFGHQELPFEQVVEAVQQRTRSLSHSPLFQAMLAFDNTSASASGEDDGSLALPELKLAPAQQAMATAQYDLSLNLTDRGDALSGMLVYASDLFDRATAERWAGHFLRLLEAMAADATAGVHELPLLSAAEREQLLVDFNATAASYPQDTLIHGLFEEKAAAQPDAVAVLFEDQSLTYGELNARANRLAHELIALGVQPDDRVAICVERGPEMVAGLLGILKAGGAYLPLDPAYPSERLQYLLHDGEPRVLLTQHALQQQLGAAGIEALLLDDEAVRERLSARPASNPVTAVTARNLAYIIYTSGSTGRPKGVAIEHANTANLLYWALENFTAEELANSLFATSINFDLAVYELFVPLAAGATLTLVRNALALTSRPEPVSLVNTVPSAIKALLDAGGVPAATRLVNLAGEPLKQEIVERLFAETATASVANLYGPSETTTYSTWVRMSREQGFAPHIGRPIANTQVYILDASRELVPLGVAGEIYIGGAGVARGYLNRPELTAERFLRDPFSSDPDARMYRTGDLGRWLPDGNIEYLGRNDFQVKIRGFRIELGEIEAKLAQCAGVTEAVVVAREDVPGDKRLIAYFTGADLSIAGLRAELSRQLPEYMIPSAFVQLDAMPLTANGKLDRSALPAPDSLMVAAREYAEPVGEVEATLAALWQEMFPVPRVGRHDNFFELGGHSLLVVQFIHRLQSRTPYRIAVRDLFQHPSLMALAAHIEAASPAVAQWTPLVRLTAATHLPVLYAVPGIGMTSASFQPLAAAMAGKVAVRAFEPRGIDGAQPFCTTMDEIVRTNVEALLADDPDGPYWLAGHSFGGAVAFEMALELEARGKDVRLCMLDSLLAAPDRQLHDTLETPLSQHTLFVDRLRALTEVQESIYDHYEPTGYFLGKTTLLFAEDSPIAAMPEAEQMAAYRSSCADVPTPRWVPGDHHTMLQTPWVHETAAELLTEGDLTAVSWEDLLRL
ncbi:MAG TPA: non-ribosomal peptide synthase/polyketide synthase [Thermoanaerobaculia bacterium]